MAQITTSKTTFLIIVVVSLFLVYVSDAFSLVRSRKVLIRVREFPLVIFAESTDNNKEITFQEQLEYDNNKKEKDATVKALPLSKDIIDHEEIDTSLDETNNSNNQVFMITQDMKRMLVEELGYKRQEVNSIRVELVANIIENRTKCPLEGIPDSWIDQNREFVDSEQGKSSLMTKLENESKYPLKFPLLAISLVLFGKGFTDALITLIKVNIDFPGASLTAQFQGISVLAIDVLCVMVGVGLGLWTLKSMK